MWRFPYQLKLKCHSTGEMNAMFVCRPSRDKILWRNELHLVSEMMLTRRGIMTILTLLMVLLAVFRTVQGQYHKHFHTISTRISKLAIGI